MYNILITSVGGTLAPYLINKIKNGRFKDLKIIGTNLIKKFNLSWLYDCCLMIDEKGEYKIIEINPRMSGSSVVSVEAGYPLFDDMISILRNKKIKKINKPINKIIFPYTSLASIKKIK